MILQFRRGGSPCNRIHQGRLSAILALLAVVAAFTVIALTLAQNWPLLLAASICMAGAGVSAAYALTRTGVERFMHERGGGIALLGGSDPVDLSWHALRVAAGHRGLGSGGFHHGGALARDVRSLKSGREPGGYRGGAQRAVTGDEPQVGGWQGRTASGWWRRTGRGAAVEPIVLTPGDDLALLAEGAIERGADDLIGMAGGDGSQALVAGVALPA